MNSIKKKYIVHIKLIICIFSVLTILNYIFKFWKSEIRYGIMSNRLFYGHPTTLAAVCIFLISSLFLFGNKTKMDKLYLFLALIILSSTMRSKAIAAAIVICIMVVIIYKTNKKISFSIMGVLALIGVILAWKQIIFYYVMVSNGGARAELTKKAIEIAKDYFPIGTGFGSPVYYKYYLDKVTGITPDDYYFISDTFWPMILGQFGIIGTICYAIILVLLFLNIQKSFEKNNNGVYIAKLICFVYLLISSTSESAFVHTIAIMLALIIGAYSKNSNGENWNENKLLGGKNVR